MTNTEQIPVTADTLSGIGLFKDLSSADRSRIASHCKGKRFTAQQQILSQKDPSRDVYFIISGTVRVTYFSRSGKEINFRDQGPGEMFGELSAIDDQPRSAQVLALTESNLISLGQEDFRDIMIKEPFIARKVMEHLSNLVRLLTERVVEYTAMGVNNRIHAELLRLAHRSPITNNCASISPVPTHADIASRVSTHREAVTRELNQLEHNGLIERRPDAWIISDIERLQTMVREVLGE